MTDYTSVIDFAQNMTEKEKIAQYKQRGHDLAVRLKEFRIPFVKVDGSASYATDMNVPQFPAMGIYRKAFHVGYIDGIDRVKNAAKDADDLETIELIGKLAAGATIACIHCDERYGEY